MEPIVASPPLRGNWNALNCSGGQVPNHGTNEWIRSASVFSVWIKKSKHFSELVF